MKNVLKKVSALLASATLLACGTAATSANAVSRNTPHNHGQFTYLDHMEKQGCKYYRVYYCSACNSYNNKVYDHTEHGSTYRKQIRAGHYERRSQRYWDGRKWVTKSWDEWVPATYGNFCCDCNARVS